MIETALSGVTKFAPDPKAEHIHYGNVSTGNSDPPAYLVAFLFLHVMGFKNYGRMEKVWWHTYFEFKGTPYLIRDYKFGTWSLEAPKDEAPDKKVVASLLRRISSAARQADKLLAEALGKQIQKGEYWINNGYRTLREAYEFYKDEIRQSKAKIDRISSTDISRYSMQERGKHFNKKRTLEEAHAFKLFPLIIAFFSFVEFFLDVVYAFRKPSVGFVKFRKLSWQERFKKVLPPTHDRALARIYEQLVSIRTRYRNPLTHGLTNQSALLVPAPYAGLVPVSLEHLSSSVHYGVPHITIASADDIVSAFTGFIGFIDTTLPYSFYVSYLDAGFAVPMGRKAVASIVSEMTDLKSFRDYLSRRSEYEDAIINRDI